MAKLRFVKAVLSGGACASVLATAAFAVDFNIPAGDLRAVLSAYMAQTGSQLVVSEGAIQGARSSGVRGNLPADAALDRLLKGTGFTARHDLSGIPGIVRSTSELEDAPVQLAQAAPVKAVETVTVTSSKLGGVDVQTVPIAITALSQEQLTATQTAGGPDLIKQVPNMSFTKTTSPVIASNSVGLVLRRSR